MVQDYLDLAAFVESVDELLESLKQDLARDQYVSVKTANNIVKVQKAAANIADIKKQLIEIKNQVN